MKPQKLWGLKHPLRVTELAPLNLGGINHEDLVRPSPNIEATTLTYVDTE